MVAGSEKRKQAGGEVGGEDRLSWVRVCLVSILSDMLSKSAFGGDNLINEILLIPAIPEELRVAARQGILVPFIGAGVSQLAGCPGWSDFADKAIDFLAQESKINHALVEQIQIKKLSPRVRLALALDWAKRANINIGFESILHADGWKSHLTGSRIYQALSSLSKHFVTTNYDLWLDEFLPQPLSLVTKVPEISNILARAPRDVIYQPKDILISALDRQVGTVVHLHGSVKDPDGMILTTGHYIERYAYLNGKKDGTDANTTQTFLEQLFRRKNVLFIGYGLDELEVLEYVILKAKRDANEEKSARHFILQPFFSYELDLANGIENYFKKECGVTLIPFLRDANNYAQLIDVIENFAREIPVGNLLNVERRHLMANLIDD